jgi:Na+-transporting methylmalonyl-CoA/oxaloacetate decarboxylase gamma subunit
MNPITGFLVAFAILVICIGVITVMSQANKKNRQEKKELEEELIKQKEQTAYLLIHAEEIGRITHDEKKVANEIKKAETDEDLVNIANAIISVNNSKLRK